MTGFEVSFKSRTWCGWTSKGTVAGHGNITLFSSPSSTAFPLPLFPLPQHPCSPAFSPPPFPLFFWFPSLQPPSGLEVDPRILLHELPCLLRSKRWLVLGHCYDENRGDLRRSEPAWEPRVEEALVMGCSGPQLGLKTQVLSHRACRLHPFDFLVFILPGMWQAFSHLCICSSELSGLEFLLSIHWPDPSMSPDPSSMIFSLIVFYVFCFSLHTPPTTTTTHKHHKLFKARTLASSSISVPSRILPMVLSKGF